MKVDFNNMRLQLARAFNKLTSELNDLQNACASQLIIWNL